MPRRVVDQGPLLDNEQRALDIAAWLKDTGLYEKVWVARSKATSGEHALTGE